VGLQGFALKSKKERPPVNVCLVLDKSGSMNGEKMANARQAAIDAVDMLRPDDIVSVVTYDTTVSVLVPATKLTDQEFVKQAIRGINAGGNTALFAGVSKGAAEIRKFLDLERVNRIILLSDGLANNGPSSPAELAELGASLKKEGISVSTLGLGLDYNEDLMQQLAARSGGNHHFIEKATELADTFRHEFDDVTSVVAQDVDVRMTVLEGIRPVRVLGNSAEINGQQVFVKLSQIYSLQDKHCVIELELPPSESGTQRDLLSVVATYRNMKSGETDRLTGLASVKFSDQADAVKLSLNKKIMEDVVALVANEQNKLATDYLDAGDIMKCREVLSSNSIFLKENARLLESEKLGVYIEGNTLQLKRLEEGDAASSRKLMRGLQQATEAQQKVSP
jgi:Ca-activated chloride channel family protein